MTTTRDAEAPPTRGAKHEALAGGKPFDTLSVMGVDAKTGRYCPPSASDLVRQLHEEPVVPPL